MAIPGYDTYKTYYPGLSRTTAGMGGDIPQQNIVGYGAAIYKRLYKSPREIALILDKTLRGGYGCLEAGTVLAQDQNTDKLVPYAPDSISDDDVARVFLMNNLTSGNNSFDVDTLESYKIASGETIILTDSDDSYEEATVSDIDRTTNNYKSTVTLASNVSGDFTTAKSANCYLKAEDSDSGKRSKAVYILDSTVDTGAGEDASGALAPVVLSNAILYQDALPNVDSTAVTNLGNVSSDGVYYVLK